MSAETRFFPPGTPLRPDYPPSWLETFLARHLWREEIPKRSDPDALYLRRFFVAGDSPNSRFFRRWKNRLYLHVFYASDSDPDPHDHPADFTTVVLRGGYRDETWEADVVAGQHVRRRVSAPVLGVGSVAHRRAEHIHRVHLLGDKAWTAVIFGPRKRTWYFYTTDRGQVHWERYLADERARTVTEKT